MYRLDWPNIQYDLDDTILSGEHISIYGTIGSGRFLADIQSA